MASTGIIYTPGGATDNCYTDLTGAGTYFANTLREVVWLGYSQSQRERALIQATAELEALGGETVGYGPNRARFAGVPYDQVTPQALHFPRQGDTNAAGAVVVPVSVKAAVCEQAWWLLERDTNAPLVDRQQLQAEGVRSVGMDGLSETYVETGVPLGIAPAAWGRLRSFTLQGHRTVVH